MTALSTPSEAALTAGGDPATGLLGDGVAALVPEGRGRILEVLLAAVAAEADARGSERRVAYRTSRHLFGGALRLGITATEIADVLGVRPHSVRARSNVDGLVDGNHFATLARIPHRELTEWQRTGLIRLEGPDNGGMHGYRASALLRAGQSRRRTGSGALAPSDLPDLEQDG
ncbi:MAG: hypothetical protein AAGC66_07945 [Leifsonia sp.]